MADVDDEEETVARECNSLQQSASTKTLLPSPIASIVSIATRSTSVYLRLGTFIGGLALDGARITTLTGLELSRSVIEGILLRAGKDVVDRSGGEMSKAEAEGLLERSIVFLHSTLTSASFIASTSFQMSAAALSSASSLSVHLLYALDSILGSTESSRAIASIITLIRREFQNPETGVKGERVGVSDLLVGITGLALLQRWCKKRTERLIREKGAEEAIWDVVVLDDGRRADVVEVSNKDQAGNKRLDIEGHEDQGGAWKRQRATSFVSTTGTKEIIRAVERLGDLPSGPSSSVTSTSQDADDVEIAWSENGLHQHLLEQLPPHAKVSITTSTRTTKTVTVEIYGADPPDFSPPPGAIIVEENAHHQSLMPAESSLNTTDDGNPPEAEIPRYRVVYQTTQNNTRKRGTDAEEVIDIEMSGDIHSPNNQKHLPIIEPLQSPSRSQDLFELSTKGEDRPFQPEDVENSYLRINHGTPHANSPAADNTNSKALVPSENNAANQKRQRRPINISSSLSTCGGVEKDELSAQKSSLPKRTPKTKQLVPLEKNGKFEKAEKKGNLRRAFTRGQSNTTLSSLWGKEIPPTIAQSLGKGKDHRPPWGSSRGSLSVGPSLPIAQRQPSSINKDLPKVPQRGSSNFFSSRDLSQGEDAPRSSSRASYYSIHESHRDSLVSQTDTYSFHSTEKLRPGSPTHLRTRAKATCELLRAKSEKDVTVNAVELAPRSPPKHHRRAKSHVPSIYTLRTNNSETSLVLANPYGKSAFEDHNAIMSLNRSGYVPSLFPRSHFVHNITRFMRFASASYGSNFLRLMGISSRSPINPADPSTMHHYEHHSFSSHTRLPPSTILLSSHFDPQGGSNSTGETDTGVPMVHFVSLDHESKAVVLTCRGTLGFEDVLTDLTCEYDDVHWRGKIYKVHKGMHASARKLLQEGGGKVMATIKAALEEYSDYGLVLCGHSLGAGVTSILSILLSEPDFTGMSGSAFVTSPPPNEAPLLMNSPSTRNNHGPMTSPRQFWLPAGRPIHVYAYGPPGTVSSSLRVATRGLITTIINGQDLVPHLSLGVLNDLQAVALAFKTDTSGAKSEVRKRVWSGLTGGLSGQFFWESSGPINEQEDDWALSALKSLRASMLSFKLMPPGEVFVLETQPVLQREAFTPGNPSPVDRYAKLGPPATRAVLKLVRDVDARFGEVRFGGSMLGDHSPGRYEMSLRALGRGVLGEEG